VGSDTALGTGLVFAGSGMQIGADGGPRTLANKFTLQDLRLSGGNSLTLTGAIDLNTAVTITVFAPTPLTLAGNIGEFTPGSVLNKSGPGFLSLTGRGLFSGGITVNADGGTVSVGGAGVLPTLGSITVNVGGTFVIDNTTAANSDRVRNAAGVTLAGGALEFRGSPTAPVAEVIGTVTANGNFTSTVTTVGTAQPTSLTANQLTRNANSYVAFRGYGATLGTANNQLLFYTPPTLQLINGILPFATVAKIGDVDFATYDPVKGVLAAPARSSLAGARSIDNVKLTAGAAIAAPTTVNALLLVGNGVTVAGAGPLTVGSGLVVATGVGDAIAPRVVFGGATGLLVAANPGTTTSGTATLDFASAVDGATGVGKFGPGRVNFLAANTYAGVTNVNEGVLRIADGAGLGVTALNSANQGTVVQAGAALELDGSVSPVGVGLEALTLSGLGAGYGNTNAVFSVATGALRSLGGSNTWAGNVALNALGV